MCLNPLLCLLIKRRAGVKTHYFLHASPLSGSSSPGDLENVCSPKRTPHPPTHPPLILIPQRCGLSPGKHTHTLGTNMAMLMTRRLLVIKKYSNELHYMIIKDKTDTKNYKKRRKKRLHIQEQIAKQNALCFCSVK